MRIAILIATHGGKCKVDTMRIADIRPRSDGATVVMHSGDAWPVQETVEQVMRVSGFQREVQ